MTTTDRTEELLRRMLQRRAGAAPPTWLLPGLAGALRTTGQVRGGTGWRGRIAMGRGRLPALVGAAAILLVAVAAGALLVGGILGPAPTPTQPAVVILPSPSDVSSMEAPSMTAATASQEPSPEPSHTPTPGTLAKDTIAVVTLAGDGLRVRSAPSVGADSKKLTPLLKKGTRMLIVRGPVSADGYEWYEVQPDDGPFGWVAAGKGSEDWIAPVEARCTDDLDQAAVRTVAPIDFLVCYGDTPVTVTADVGEWNCCDTGSVEPACPSTGDDVPCTTQPTWLFEPRAFTLVPSGEPIPGDEGTGEFWLAGQRTMLRRLDQVPNVAAMTMTLSMDAAEADDCRIVDRRGRNLISRDEAITRCRLQFVIRDIAWDEAYRDLLPDTIARVVAPSLPLHADPDTQPTGQQLAAGDEVLIQTRYSTSTGITWYDVLSTDGRLFGFVPFTGDDGQPTLAAVAPNCPSAANWSAVEGLSPAGRLACFGHHRISLNLLVDDREPPNDYEGLCDLYRASTSSPRPCLATPGWLASYSGVFGVDPKQGGNGIELRFDPRKVKRDWLPASPAVMRVTGSFSNTAADDCEAVDPGHDESLFDDDEVSPAYCRTQFVATSIVPLPSPR